MNFSSTTPDIAPVPNERMVYAVRSVSNPGRHPYRVDLLANGGFGECSCVDWSTRRWPAIKEGAAMGLRSTMCRHVILARRLFLNGLLREMAAAEDNGE